VNKSAQAVGAERMVNVALRLVGIYSEARFRPQRRNEWNATVAPARLRANQIMAAYAGAAPPNLAQRALFRMNMRGRSCRWACLSSAAIVVADRRRLVEGAGNEAFLVWMRCSGIAATKKYGQDGNPERTISRKQKPRANAGFCGRTLFGSANSQMFVRNATLRFSLGAGPEVQRSA